MYLGDSGDSRMFILEPTTNTCVNHQHSSVAIVDTLRTNGKGSLPQHQPVSVQMNYPLSTVVVL